MTEKFKTALKQDGRTLKWFYDCQVKKKLGLSYNAMCLQLNGYVAMSDKLKLNVRNYLEQHGETAQTGS